MSAGLRPSLNPSRSLHTLPSHFPAKSYKKLRGGGKFTVPISHTSIPPDWDSPISILPFFGTCVHTNFCPRPVPRPRSLSAPLRYGQWTASPGPMGFRLHLRTRYLLISVRPSTCISPFASDFPCRCSANNFLPCVATRSLVPCPLPPYCSPTRLSAFQRARFRCLSADPFPHPPHLAGTCTHGTVQVYIEDLLQCKFLHLVLQVFLFC